MDINNVTAEERECVNRCPICGGRGWVLSHEHLLIPDETESLYDLCPRCHGTCEFDSYTSNGFTTKTDLS